MKRVEPKLYTRNYYLTESTGFVEFKKCGGMKMDYRMNQVIKLIPNVDNSVVLDIGCGRGEYVYWAVVQGAKNVIGIDYSKDAIKIANEAKKKWPKHIQKKVKFVVADGKDVKFKKDMFDLVISTEVFEHLYDHEQIKLLKNIKKYLKKDGKFFIHTSPTRYFSDYTYKYWCYPVSSLLVNINNFLTRSNYGNILQPDKLRNDHHLQMHVNEPTYFGLKKMIEKAGYKGDILSSNISFTKPIISWKDSLFNFLVFFKPIANYPPFNILLGEDFYMLLTKK